jgi:Fe-S-cluster containining protein
MKIETDIRRVKELAALKEDANWRFRSFLKGIDLSTEEVDAVVHRHYQAASVHIDCCACGNCCREGLPRLCGSDIERLASGLNTTESEVVSSYLEPGKEPGSFSFRSKPCPFLSGNKCTVYDSRPNACRSYPHLHKKEFVFRLIQAVDNCSVCPIVFNVFERLKEELWHSPTSSWMDDDFTDE